MGRQSPLIICVDSPGAERQKPPAIRPELQLEFCAEGTASRGAASHLNLTDSPEINPQSQGLSVWGIRAHFAQSV